MGEYHKPIYLDFHATTPVDPRIMEAMLPYFTEHFGNPASRSHPYGWQASEAVEIARKQVADLLNVARRDIYFNSGATEGLNMAIKGLAESMQLKGKHIISVSTEHHAVLDPLSWLSDKGYDITILSVDEFGMLDIDLLNTVIRQDTIMLIVMWANNETGVIHDMKAIGEICKEKEIALVCDATQATGKIITHPVENGIDIMAFSGHKIYGPKGTGAIYIDQNTKRLKPEALIHGGGHESGFRSGTLNVPGIVGLGTASKLRMLEFETDAQRIKTLRDKFENMILSKLEYVTVNGNTTNRLYSVSNLRIAKVDSQAIMTRLRTKLALSSGSACSSADPSPSHVLLAMGLSDEEARGSIRVSLGRPTTSEDMETAAELLTESISEYRSESPQWQMFKQGIEF